MLPQSGIQKYKTLQHSAHTYIKSTNLTKSLFLEILNNFYQYSKFQQSHSTETTVSTTQALIGCSTFQQPVLYGRPECVQSFFHSMSVESSSLMNL